MYPLLSLPATSLLFAMTGAMAVLAATLYDVRLWRSRWLWPSALGAFGPGLLGLALWRFGSLQTAAIGVTLSWTTLPVLASAALAAVVVMLSIRVFASGFRGRSTRSARAGARRDFLRGAAAMLPLGAGAAAARGFAGADTTRVIEVPLEFADLPAALDGLRILHLSDLHLGASRTSADLSALLGELREDPPDLIVLTGDVADDLAQLEAGLAVITGFAPRYGVYAALGNHEYLNDIQKTLPIYQRSALELLVNQTRSLTIDGATLFIAGVDDPVFSGPARPFFEKTVSACAETAPVDAFRLLLCHRPEGFEAAARHGFQLTLSGHTHGAQIGLFGRSALEVLFGIPYLWGSYTRGESRLYTTSGFGHWFPFRLNCPAEAPIIELRRKRQHQQAHV